MKIEHGITLEEKHGQYYARWRSDEIVKNKHGEEVKKQYFEPTYVPLLFPGATDDKVQQQREFAFAVAAYMKSLTGSAPPSTVRQQIKLREFGLQWAETGEDANSLKMFIPLFLIDYAHTVTKRGAKPLLQAVKTMITTWNRILEALGPDRDKHPSVIPVRRLQTIVDSLPGKQERHVTHLKRAYTDGVRMGYVLSKDNPAAEVVARKVAKVSRLPFKVADVQRGLRYMEHIQDGDQWQLVTLCGVYTPMRFLTACRLQVMPVDFVRPDRPRACAVLDTTKWHIEYYDTKSENWEVQVLDAKFIAWFKPYIKKHQKMVPGDFLFPALARNRPPPSARWEQIMERSGCKMEYSKSGCRTGYHALRISRDMWVKVNDEVLLSRDEIETKLQRHSRSVHRKSYDSGAVNICEQRRINESLPAFLRGDSQLTAMLFEVRQQKQKLLAELQAVELQEHDLEKLIQKEPHDQEAN